MQKSPLYFTIKPFIMINLPSLDPLNHLFIYKSIKKYSDSQARLSHQAHRHKIDFMSLRTF